MTLSLLHPQAKKFFNFFDRGRDTEFHVGHSSWMWIHLRSEFHGIKVIPSDRLTSSLYAPSGEFSITIELSWYNQSLLNIERCDLCSSHVCLSRERMSRTNICVETKYVDLSEDLTAVMWVKLVCTSSRGLLREMVRGRLTLCDWISFYFHVEDITYLIHVWKHSGEHRLVWFHPYYKSL